MVFVLPSRQILRHVFLSWSSLLFFIFISGGETGAQVQPSPCTADIEDFLSPAQLEGREKSLTVHFEDPSRELEDGYRYFFNDQGFAIRTLPHLRGLFGEGEFDVVEHFVSHEGEIKPTVITVFKKLSSLDNEAELYQAVLGITYDSKTGRPLGYRQTIPLAEWFDPNENQPSPLEELQKFPPALRGLTGFPYFLYPEETFEPFRRLLSQKFVRPTYVLGVLPQNENQSLHTQVRKRFNFQGEITDVSVNQQVKITQGSHSSYKLVRTSQKMAPQAHMSFKNRALLTPQEREHLERSHTSTVYTGDFRPLQARFRRLDWSAQFVFDALSPASPLIQHDSVYEDKRDLWQIDFEITPRVSARVRKKGATLELPNFLSLEGHLDVERSKMQLFVERKQPLQRQDVQQLYFESKPLKDLSHHLWSEFDRSLFESLRPTPHFSVYPLILPTDLYIESSQNSTYRIFLKDRQLMERLETDSRVIYESVLGGFPENKPIEWEGQRRHPQVTPLTADQIVDISKEATARLP